MADPKTPEKDNINDHRITKESLHEYIKMAVNKLGPEFTKEQKKEHAKLLVKIFEKGMSPREAMNISDSELAEIYSYAYHKFSEGDYLGARDLFKIMFSLDPMNCDFATALGVCFHRLKEYEQAINCYMMGFLLEPESPVCLFYAYDCFMKLENEVSAGIMLCNVITTAGDNPAYAHIKKDAQLRLDQLQKKLVDDQVGITNQSS